MLTKCISFSLWGDDPFYCVGAVENTILASKFFPDWDAVFYCDQTVPDFYLREIQNNGGKVVLNRNNKNINYQNTFERFINSLNYDIFITRDTDSRIGSRDVWAVNRWLKSTKIYHSIRDAFCTYNFTPQKIQGGTFGVKVYLDEFKLCERAQQYMKANQTAWEREVDEHFLNNVVYLSNKKNFFIHATQYNNFKDTTELIPMDIPCEYGHYIGQKINPDNTPVLPRYNLRKLRKLKLNGHNTMPITQS